MSGYKFRRQVLIGNNIADFMGAEKSLIIELVGSQHAAQSAYDEKRDAFLKAMGFRVLRKWEFDFLENSDGVMEMVLREIETAPSP